jgi:hypothetical protein
MIEERKDGHQDPFISVQYEAYPPLDPAGFCPTVPRAGDCRWQANRRRNLLTGGSDRPAADFFNAERDQFRIFAGRC